MITTELGASKKIKTAALDEDPFWRGLQSSFGMLSSIAHAISEIESDSAHLSDTQEILLNVSAEVEKAFPNSTLTTSNKKKKLQWESSLTDVTWSSV